MIRALAKVMVGAALLAGLAGCSNPREEFGKTYYLDGAGNWGFGVADVPAGLRAAGYQGDVEVFVWTSSFSPAVDQVNLVGNKLRAAILSGKIGDYRTRHPGKPVNLVALSAGTGIAVWAVEGLAEGVTVDNVVLLGSSLSYNYDMRKALRHVKGRVYVFYSPHDEVLTTGARVLGTVDRTFEDSAGLVGLRPVGGDSSKIVNIGWSPRYSQYGWTGSHTDATSQAFVQAVIAPKITGAAGAPPVAASFAARREAQLAGRSDPGAGEANRPGDSSWQAPGGSVTSRISAIRRP